MSKYTLDEVFEECQKLKLKNDMGLTALERAMIGLAFMRGEQRQENCESKYKKFNPFREKNLKSYGIVDVTRSIVARRQNSYTDVWAVWAWGRGNQGVRYVQAKSHYEAIDQVLEGSK